MSESGKRTIRVGTAQRSVSGVMHSSEQRRCRTGTTMRVECTGRCADGGNVMVR